MMFLAECTKDTLRIFLELASDGSVKDILNSFGSVVFSSLF